MTEFARLLDIALVPASAVALCHALFKNGKSRSLPRRDWSEGIFVCVGAVF